MRAVVQRVSSASVRAESGHFDEMGRGMVILLGIEEEDGEDDLQWLAGKICRLRIFNDDRGVMNHSLQEDGGRCMVISQFTLHASTKKGNRPSWIRAAQPDRAKPLYLRFIDRLEQELRMPVISGVFGDHMDITLVNDGPVTLIIDSKLRE
ncbi:MAG: D-aminoacyl-tRNA deacylase [Bacteroidota bacterium]